MEHQDLLLDDEDRTAISVTVTPESRAVDQRRFFYVSVLSQSGALLAAKTVVAPLDRLKLIRQIANPSAGLFSDRHWFRGYRLHMSQLLIGNFSKIYLLSKFSAWNQGKSEISSHVAAAVAATVLVYPLDVRYTLRAAGVGNFFSNFSGFRYSLVSTPIYLLTSLGTLRVLDEKKFPIISGSLAALAGSVASYPVDTLRRRSIAGISGRANLFAGVGVHVLKAIPECAVLGVVYSELIRLRYL